MAINRTPVHAESSVMALLVDRDVDTRKMYAEYLRRSHYDVDEAEDGREALAKAIDTHPDVVVTETRLPGMDGFALCALLHQDAATRDIPVVFVTGDAFEDDVRRAHAAGAESVLVKPCLPEDLLAELGRLKTVSKDLRARSRATTENVAQQIARSDVLIERSHAAIKKRVTLSKALHRHDTITPPIPPPHLVCPVCDQALKYTRSHIGGVSARHLEQWDYYECTGGCGTFQYRERTKKLRKV
jgi:two-component system, cell cycle response regulator DivK